MKAKRLTALALAALMAASTTSVALAGERVTNDLDIDTPVQYYKYDSDEGMLVKVDNDAFQPGDDVYILLEETPTKLPNAKTYNAYGSWQIGDSWVKDIDLVYRKGAIPTPGTTTTKYTIKGLSGEFESLNGTVLSANTKEALEAAVKGSSAYTTKVNNLVESKYKATFYTVTDETPEHFYKESEKNAACEKAVDLAVSASTIVKDNYGTVDSVPYKGNSLPSHISKKDIPSGYIVDGIYYDTLKDAMAKVNGWYVYNSTNFAGKTLYDDTSSEYGTASKKGSTTLTQSEEIFVNVSPDKFEDTSDIKFIKTTCLRENVITAVGSGIEVPSATVYCDTNAGNKVVTVNENAGEAYFKQQDNAFLGTVAQKATVGEKLGTVNTIKDYADAAGNKTDKTGAETAAKAEVDATLKLTVADNIDTQVTTTPGKPSAQYEYWIKITTKDSATTKDIDVVGKVSVGTSKSSAEKEQEVPIDFTLTNSDPGNSSHDEATDYVSIEPGERAVVSFADDAGDVVVEFGDDAWFEFNARGQGKLNLAYNTKYNKDFAYDYDDANIDFITFEGEPTTNRTGTMYIYADRDTYIYEVTDRGAKSIAYLPAGGTGAVSAKTAAGKINGAYYDKDEDAWVFRTRHLTSYAISDKKLKTVDQMENGSSSSSGSNSGSNNNNGKPNPDTGR